MRRWRSIYPGMIWYASLALVLPVWAASTLPVVATFSILGDVVQQVGGDTITLHTLVGPDGDTHTFEPSPRDGIILSQAALVFEIGLAFETWLDKLYDASGATAKRVVVSTGLPLLPAAEAPAHHAADQHDTTLHQPAAAKHDHERAGAERQTHTTHAEGHQYGEYDPHVWHDVPHMIHVTKQIRGALIQVAPAHTEIYRANAARYMQDLHTLDTWIREAVHTLPVARRKLVTSHDVFGYFAQRYGFTEVGTALGSLSTDVADPSAGAIAALVNKIRAENVPAIFAETMHNPKVVERIAAATGAKLPPPLYTDALGPSGSPGETYIKMMRYNVTTIVHALQQP